MAEVNAELQRLLEPGALDAWPSFTVQWAHAGEVEGSYLYDGDDDDRDKKYLYAYSREHEVT